MRYTDGQVRVLVFNQSAAVTITDLFIHYDFRDGPYVLIQAATEQGRIWLQSIRLGIRIDENLLLQNESCIAAVLDEIPTTLCSVTL